MLRAFNKIQHPFLTIKKKKTNSKKPYHSIKYGLVANHSVTLAKIFRLQK